VNLNHNLDVKSERDSSNNTPIPTPNWCANQNSRSWFSLVNCSTPEARALLPKELALKLNALPTSIVYIGNEAHLVVIIGDNSSNEDVAAIRFSTGYSIITESYESVLVHRAITIAYANKSVFETENDKLLYEIIDQAIALGASDIHIEPSLEDYIIRFRIDGGLKRYNASLSLAEGNKLIRKIKVLANAEPCARGAVEGAFTYNEFGESTRIRISTLTLAQGEKAVLRLLDNRKSLPPFNTHLGFASLGLRTEQIKELVTALAQTQGLIVATGPTGSGKSTLLHSALSYLNNGARNITSIEDPVERVINGINQIEVNENLGITYDTILPPLLRQDPDIIMLGELRTSKTAISAINAAITGHLVLTTLHAGSSVEALIRLKQLTGDEALILSAVKLIISQRLIPKVCENCKKEVTPNQNVKMAFILGENDTLSEGDGCTLCGGSGVSGVVGVFELLPCTNKLRLAIKNNGLEYFLDNSALTAIISPNFQTLAFGIRELLVSQIIDLNAALHALGVAKETLEV